MKLAVMQPYIFPYIGYFQLVSAVDKFIFLDNVNFIKKGWINRNRLNKSLSFSVPCINISQNRHICDTFIDWESQLIDKLFRTIEMRYSKSLYFKQVYDIINQVFACKVKTISELAENSVKAFSRYIGLDTQFSTSSQNIYHSNDLKGSQRIIDIVKSEGAEVYINAIGGLELYNKADFIAEGIELKFLKTGLIERFDKEDYMSFYSIIDVAMHNSPDKIYEKLKNYELI